MKLKSLFFSIVILHVFALGVAWVLVSNPVDEKTQSNYKDFGNDALLVSLPSSNLAYPVLTLFGKSYIKGEHPNLMSEIKMDSIDYSGWNPAFYQPSYQRSFIDVYSLEGLSMWKP
ncbi:hypothetical protein [Owenweeksia hongkongensis]|uniref:Uncharacterized protein n=1 Tax=Owenweeksia hongkongensis (strain DSM 17368 / CIP 108786 / JCM 12287 / NRRL B-23963 / UST20020801) TaxID=926562 RepID=G8R3P9_OWEHD|nr:hypothetical protein [Owenweeksia hongkongensis]AEV34136.1 hypothetical protein Oweho_3184 [Owenweeksia hongkongensis DSM 17368]